VYRFFRDKEAIVEALALRYWSEFEDLVAAAAEADAREPLTAPEVIVDVLAAGFRARPGFLALWFGGLRTEHIRDVTRPSRTAIARSLQTILAHHWPQASAKAIATTAEMVVIGGDGLLREAFRRDLRGDKRLLRETKVLLASYIATRLGGQA
jgi:AcrR family transcriptional regulator